MDEPRIRILCVDDHAVVRAGLASIINSADDMEVIGLAANGREALEQFARLRPDVTLMDLRMPGMGGLDAIRAIRAAYVDARIIVLTMYEGDADIHRAMEAGAVAYLLKNALADSLIHRIRAVHRGLDAGVEEGQRAHQHRSALSPREEEVLRLLASGLRNKEASAVLGISEGTVNAHVKRIYAKLQVHDRAGALSTAIRRGIIHVD